MKYLTTSETAELLRISQQQLADWRFVGRGPKFVREGRKILYSVRAIEEWERRQTYQSTAQYSR